MTDSPLNIQLLLTGNEIMSGDTVDSNSALIAQRFGEAGLGIYRKVTVGDDVTLLRTELADMATKADLIIVNGGLGPTIDDLTAEILAAVAGVPLQKHPQAVAHLEQWCAKRNLQLDAANLKQSMLPKGATIVDNPIGSAVGFEMTLGHCRIICTPGVPSELAAMLGPIVAELSRADAARPRAQYCAPANIWSGRIYRAANHQRRGVRLAIRSRAGLSRRRTANGNQTQHRQRSRQRRTASLSRNTRSLVWRPHHRRGDTLLAHRVLELLEERGASLTTAESCTGGLIASMLTRIPGSSQGFHAGFVTYSNAIKQSVLGVNAQTLADKGAVSEEVVREMALGALQRSGADYAIAVSGIAGPDGGTEEKPVGTVWLAWGDRHDIRTRCLVWPVDRTLFQTMLAAAGLDMMRRFLLGIDEEPRYFAQRQAR